MLTDGTETWCQRPIYSYFFEALLVWAPLNCQTPKYCLCDFCLWWKLHNYVSSYKKYYHLTVNRYPLTFCNPKTFGAHRQKYWGNDYGMLSLTWTEATLQNNIIVLTTLGETKIHHYTMRVCPRFRIVLLTIGMRCLFTVVLWMHDNVEYL